MTNVAASCDRSKMALRGAARSRLQLRRFSLHCNAEISEMRLLVVELLVSETVNTINCEDLKRRNINIRIDQSQSS